MQLIDLTRLLDPNDRDRVPEPYRTSQGVVVPGIKYHTPHGEGADVMCSRFECTREDLPDGQGWGAEEVQLTSHSGTHVDAPLHYGSQCEGKPARTITDINLNELFCDGLVLDMRGRCKQGEGITIEALKEALALNGGKVTPGCALMLRTGQEAFTVADPDWYNYPGMTRDSTLFLADLGAKILGTDALGWDRPFAVMRKAFKETGNRKEIWDGHFAGRDREVFIIQQLSNLAALPAHGFKVGFFPLKLARCSAAPARVVAFVS